MIVARTVFQAKFGKADDVVANLKESLGSLSEEQLAHFQPRILTDISGRFDTVVMETRHESLGAYEQMRKALMEQPAVSTQRSAMFDLVETGHNEYWTIEH